MYDPKLADKIRSDFYRSIQTLLDEVPASYENGIPGEISRQLDIIEYTLGLVKYMDSLDNEGMCRLESDAVKNPYRS